MELQVSLWLRFTLYEALKSRLTHVPMELEEVLLHIVVFVWRVGGAGFGRQSRVSVTSSGNLLANLVFP